MTKHLSQRTADVIVQAAEILGGVWFWKKTTRLTRMRSTPLSEEVATGWPGQVDVYTAKPLKLEGAGRKGGIVKHTSCIGSHFESTAPAHVLLSQSKSISSIPRVIFWLSHLPFLEGILCTKAIHVTAASL